ncbi:MAG: mannan endo-1,4-beta-mannosidase, partial [Candidatus Nanohaloarchaea archaeon]
WGDHGMDRYVAWSDTASQHDDFYTDDQIQEWYRGFVEKLVTRKNRYNGREYRSDPAIMMWELANEPRFDQDYDGFRDWVDATASFLHSLDGNHLVSTGSDRYTPERFEEIHAVDGIDACSIHLWPQN